MGSYSYSYDQLGRITSAHTDAANDPRHLDNPPEQFAWDAASNLLPYGGADKLWNNRITVHQDKRYEYDAKGRLINKKIGKHTVARFASIVSRPKLSSHDFCQIERSFPHSGHSILPPQPRLNHTANQITIIATAL